ncbi:helix-turn-helix transcriptional regulator [Nannocystaceae bacterium ST9]
MKSSAKPEPKARAAADSQDSLESSDSPTGSADDTREGESSSPLEEERASEPLATPTTEPGEPKSKRKSKVSRTASASASEPNNVRKLRQEAMMSKAELARRAGVSPLTIDRVEAGSPCRMDTKRKILEALGLSPSARAEVWPDIDDQG